MSAGGESFVWQDKNQNTNRWDIVSRVALLKLVTRSMAVGERCIAEYSSDDNSLRATYCNKIVRRKNYCLTTTNFTCVATAAAAAVGLRRVERR